MKKFRLIYILCIFSGFVSCSKENDEGDETIKENLIGTWTATSGKYDLQMEITSSEYDFRITQEGKGGVYDVGTYDVSGNGQITFVNNNNNILGAGQLKNEKLTITFVNSVAIMMLGVEGAANVVFTRSASQGEGTGYLIVQNLSDNNTIKMIDLYDGSGNYIDSDSESLEPGYQFTYSDFDVGNYIIKVTDNKGSTYTSKSFKIVKDKYTVLTYTGTALNVTSTGVNKPVSGKAPAYQTVLKQGMNGSLIKNIK